MQGKEIFKWLGNELVDRAEVLVETVMFLVGCQKNDQEAC